MTRAAIYVRISSDPEGLRAGVERQEKDCRAYCARQGWDVAEVYADNDVSAYSGKARPAYRRMLTDLEARRVDAVVAWHNDRLHRSPRELEEFIDLVERTGVAVSMVEGGTYDLTTSDGRLAARIVGAVARKESEDKSRRIRRKHLDLAEKGLPAGGQQPFGYRDQVGGTRVVEESEAILIKEAAAQVLDGASLRAIATDWNRRGIATSTGGRWTTVGVKRVLTAPRIAGLREHHRARKPGDPPGKLYPATWPAIVDRDTFEELRLVLTDPKRTKNGGVNARSYLLAGMAFCGGCGAKLYARPRADKVRCYVCISGTNFHGCGKIRRMADPVEDLVRDAVLTAVDSRAVRDAVQAVEDEDPSVRAAAVALARAEERLGRLEEAHYVTGELPEATYKSLRAGLEREIDRLRVQAESRVQGRILAGLPAGYDALRARWDAADLVWRRELVSTVIERVIVHPARRGYNRFDPTKVEVVWRS